ncbi:hypothetical protein HMPREF2533_00419 [Bacteroides fragilis]|nr:hypothetical protein HMPREF2530_00419 [Bacteroides fragilis]KXU50396.1 hypothetical protein HMPREF2533_00419 [Bacteroides fragilis]
MFSLLCVFLFQKQSYHISSSKKKKRDNILNIVNSRLTDIKQWGMITFMSTNTLKS